MSFANCRLEKCLSCSHLLATLSLLLHHANIICDHSNALNTMSPYSHAHLHCLLCMSLTCCVCPCICTAPCPDVSKFVKLCWGSTIIAVLPYYCRTTLLLHYHCCTALRASLMRKTVRLLFTAARVCLVSCFTVLFSLLSCTP